jgi:hypothetical protein
LDPDFNGVKNIYVWELCPKSCKKCTTGAIKEATTPTSDSTTAVDCSNWSTREDVWQPVALPLQVNIVLQEIWSLKCRYTCVSQPLEL